MAPTISLATYTVEIHAVRKNDPLHLKFQKGESAASLHADLLKQLQDLKATGERRDVEQQVLKVLAVESDASDIWGVVERGEYGSEASIVNSKTFGQTHLQKTTEARLGRFYFRLHLPCRPGNFCEVKTLIHIGIEFSSKSIRLTLTAYVRGDAS
jgi:hypothetical protein